MIGHVLTAGAVDLTTKSISDVKGIVVLVFLFAVTVFFGWFLREEFHQRRLK